MYDVGNKRDFISAVQFTLRNVRATTGTLANTKRIL